MNISITPKTLKGKVSAIPSKSHGQRLIIGSYLAHNPLSIDYPSKDFLATTSCMKEMEKEAPYLPCNESGATLRFLLPLSMVLHKEATFQRKGRLSERPLKPLDQQMKIHGCQFVEKGSDLKVTGPMSGGDFFLPGDVSSQYITGLLMALPLTAEGGKIIVTSSLESSSYVDLTLSVLKTFSIKIKKEGRNYLIGGNQKYTLTNMPSVDGDWSNGAFWIVANALTSSIDVEGLSTDSVQGDKAITHLIHSKEIDGTSVPDLIPILSVKAALTPGKTILSGLKRLRLKESDRIETTFEMITSLGGTIKKEGDSLVIHGKKQLEGGLVDSYNDHRIAMATAIAATCCKKPVTLLNSQAVNKSYPHFFKDYQDLGGEIHEI